MAMEKPVKRLRRFCLAVLALIPVCFAGCAMAAESPIDKAGSAARLPRATYYTVAARHGDTVTGIAFRYNVSIRNICIANGIEHDERLRPGEILRIPAGSQATREAVLNEAANAPERNAVFPLPLPKGGYVRLASLAPPKHVAAEIAEPSPRPEREADIDAIIADYAGPSDDGAVQPKAKPAEAHLASLSPVQSDIAAYDPQHVSSGDDSGRFVWPVAGRVISPFGKVASGERNDGINIAASLGAPIHAAAAGTVTYAGNGIKGYGNLILIRHEDGYVTAYAHAQSILVSRGDRVDKGQAIGYAGETGDVREPQLHFEIRHGVRPVDPRPLLMASR